MKSSAVVLVVAAMIVGNCFVSAFVTPRGKI